MALQLFANIDRNTMVSGLVVSATNLSQRPAPELVAGDKVSFDIFLTSKSGILDIQTYSVKRLALGALNATPTGGTYKVDYGGSSHSTLQFNATAQDFADAITNNAPSVPTPVTGTQIAPFTYIIDFGSNGTCDLPTIESSLTPASSVSVQRLITGDDDTKEQWLVRIYQDPIALVDAWTNIEPTTGQKGIRGALNLGTQGIFDLLDSNASASTTMELELTDSSGNLQTIFQSPVTIFSQVIGEAIAGIVPAPEGIPASATTFLNSFPDPSIVGNLDVGGNASIFGTLSASGGNFQTDSFGNLYNVSSITSDGNIAGRRITTREIQCEGTLPAGGDAEPIFYDAKEHRFRDFDANPNTLMIIEKIAGYTGARVGINKDPSSSSAVALHVVAGKNSSTNVKDLGLKVTGGGAFFEKFIRIGHYTDTERDAIDNPTNGTVIYNETHHEFQGYIGGGGGAGGWKKFQLTDVSS